MEVLPEPSGANIHSSEYPEQDPYAGDERHSKYWRSLQFLKPYRNPKRKVPAPIENSGLFSFATLSWISSIVTEKKEFEIKDLPILSKYDSCKINCERFTRLYEEDKKKHDGKPSIKRTFFRFIRTRIIVSLIILYMFETLYFIGPSVLLNSILRFAESSSPVLNFGVGLAVALGVTEISKCLIFASFWAMQYRTIVQIRAAILSFLFQKIARLRSLQNKSIGELVNLLGNDAERMTEAILFGVLLMGAPGQFIAIIIYSCYLIGWTGALGVLLTLSFLPIQFGLGKLMTKYRRQYVKFSDTRVRMMNEILTCIKLIKMYAWESSFAQAIAKIRFEETKILSKVCFIQSCLTMFIPTVPVAAAVITFLVHTLLRYPLTAPEAFSILAVYNTVRYIISVSPRAIISVAEVLIGFRRMDSLLMMEEMTSYYHPCKDEDDAVKFENVTAAWDGIEAKDADASDGENVKENDDTSTVLFDINLTIKKKKIIGICGPVGNGKSSFMSTILGQLRIIKGSISLDGRIAYVPQQAWIFHNTARENILFGLPWNEDRYNTVIKACSLESDFKILPDNDLTEIGERGINLSGGQKQRVSLARAVYSDRDIILLDDPLSAVDAHVGKHIFFECIKNLLADKTVIFVTHQLQYLKDCDEVILIKDGKITERGTHDELMTNQKEYTSLLNNYHSEQEKKNHQPVDIVDEKLVQKVLEDSKSLKTSSNGETKENTNDVATDKKDEALSETITNSDNNIDVDDDEKTPMVLIKAEERESGSVKVHTYISYIKASGGWHVAIFLMMLFLLSAAGSAGNNWWLTIWLNAGNIVTTCTNLTTGANVTLEQVVCKNETDPNVSQNPDLEFYQMIYFIIFLVVLVVLTIKAAIFSRVCMKASSNLHNRVFRSVMSSAMWFFDTTPTGRILNRFSRDMDEIDNRMPFYIDNLIFQSLLVLTSFVTIIYVFPWFLIPLVFLAIIFGFFYHVFRRSIRQIKRLDNTARSPWFSHVTSTIQGLGTIHAYNKTDDIIATFNKLFDTHTSPYFAYHSTVRWLAVRLDAITVAITTFTAFFIVFSTVYPEYLGERSSAFGGLALTYSIMMTGLFQVTIRFSLQTEALFTSVERMNEYITGCPSEKKQDAKDTNLPEGWPKTGSLEFKEVSLRYRDGLPLVLKQVNFNVKSQEKIGIVGRTGSGKSSLGTALFRLVDFQEGQIFFDGLDISTIPLNDLRRNISIIPQDPVLFIGTIRYNLDPFNQYSDDELWKALERSHMKSVINALPQKLESEVVENGENFSVGERQLLCMARAILRHSRVIMLDEATAAIDSETDNLVQTTIREAFSDCTMLTIAHRLNTILNCDKILVMDDGKVAEFDDTNVLLSDPSSSFSKMVALSNAKKE